MANPRGEVTIYIDGKRVLAKLTMESLMAFEEHIGLPAPEFFARMDGRTPKMQEIALLWWAALLDSHPDLTPEQARKIVPDTGVGSIMKIVVDVVTAAFPVASPDDAEAQKNAARPPKASGRGTGSRS